MLSLFAKRLTLTEQNKVIEISNKLGINPNWLLAVMYFETGGTLSPTTTNRIGSVGLIQFTRDKAGVEYKTIKKVRYYLSEIKKMSFVRQMDLVFDYLDEVCSIYRIKLRSFNDVYFAVFFPLAMGRSSTYVLKSNSLSASIIAKQNLIFDKNSDGKVTVSEVVSHFSKYYGTVFTEIKKKV